MSRTYRRTEEQLEELGRLEAAAFRKACREAPCRDRREAQLKAELRAACDKIASLEKQLCEAQNMSGLMSWWTSPSTDLFEQGGES